VKVRIIKNLFQKYYLAMSYKEEPNDEELCERIPLIGHQSVEKLREAARLNRQRKDGS
jgi:hypothetical protein